MHKNRSQQIFLAAFLLLCTGLYLCITPIPAVADPHGNQSLNVAIIGSPVVINGGTLPTIGPVGELGDFTFSNLAPGAAIPANIDTVVLNVASPQMGCTTATLSALDKAALVSFVSLGGKLIIYDSECRPNVGVDYSWLPFPFTTSNPGALGATGTLFIAEENTLSTSIPGLPAPGIHFIDAVNLGSNTDAVGDMNVMVTLDPNWCLDMSGTNVQGLTGPVHTYARHGSGLIIYNGLDVDFVGFEPTPPAPHGLRKIWVQELQVPFNPTPQSDLPCGTTVVGIALTPLNATNEVGQNHTVTASLTDLQGNPQTAITVTFNVIAGPNAGAAGVCSPNADCTTDANGQVSFTYTGSGGIGQDQIQASFVNDLGVLVNSLIVDKDWINRPPDCTNAVPSIDLLWPPNHKFVLINILGVTDPDGDPVTITIDSILQDEPVDTFGDGSFSPDGQGIGTDTAQVRAERSGSKKVPGNGRVYHIFFTADDGKGGACTGEVLVGVPHDQGQQSVPIDDGALFDSTVVAP